MRKLLDKLDDRLEDIILGEDEYRSTDLVKAEGGAWLLCPLVIKPADLERPKSFWSGIVEKFNALTGNSAGVPRAGEVDVQNKVAASVLHAGAVLKPKQRPADDIDKDLRVPLLVRNNTRRPVGGRVQSPCVVQNKSDSPKVLEHLPINKCESMTGPAYNMSKVKVNRVSADILREFDPLSQTACCAGVEANSASKSKGGGDLTDLVFPSTKVMDAHGDRFCIVNGYNAIGSGRS